MDITIHLSSAAEAKLKERAAATGQPPDAVASRIVEEAVTTPTLDEVLAPVREDFARSGMTDDELGDFLEDVKHKMRREQGLLKP